MKPVVFSSKDHKEGWKRAGYDISYYKNNITRVTKSFKFSKITGRSA